MSRFLVKSENIKKRKKIQLILIKTFKGYAFNAQNRLFSFRAEDRERLIQGILDLDVSVHEVEKFEPAEEVKKVATFNRTGEKLEVLATYSKEVSDLLV